jgi:streptogramin lyase
MNREPKELARPPGFGRTSFWSVPQGESAIEQDQNNETGIPPGSSTKESRMRRNFATTWFSRFGLSLVAGLLWCAAGLGQVITEFPVESVGGIWPGHDGAMWFTSYHGGPQVGRIDSNGLVTELGLPASAYAIAPGSDGNLWITTRDGIVRMTPSGVFTLFPVVGATALDITSGPDGNLWFTKDEDPHIGRITTSGTVTEFLVPTDSAPRYITAGPDGNVWFTKPDDKIGRITTSGVVTEFATPTSNVWPHRIAAGPDGNVWFTATYGLGRITTSGAITEFVVPEVYDLAAGIDGNLWAAGFGILKRITPDGLITVFSVPTETSESFAPQSPSIAAAPDGSIWIADYNNSKIVRFSPASTPTSCVTGATTLCLDGGRFRVTTDWRRRDGSTGQGRAVDLTANSGYFWFFDANNIEVVVKVLDGCSANQHHWAFAAGLTNVEVRTTVTDTYTGISKFYTNPLGTAFTPVQDTAAFGTCP